MFQSSSRRSSPGQRAWNIAAVLFVAWVCLYSQAKAQQAGENKQPANQPGMVRLTLPPNAEVKHLIDYVSQRLGVKILYDEALANKKISVKAPEPIPADTLLDVLESALKMKGLAIVDAEVEGWKRIVVADDLPRISVPGLNRPLEDFRGTTAVTQAFTLKYLSPETLGPILTPFLTKQGANTITVGGQNVLIITDYADNLRRVAMLIESIDRGGPKRVLKFYEVQHVEAGELSKQITQSLTSQAAAQPPGTRPVAISHDQRTNQLMLVGTKEQIALALELAGKLDVSLGQKTEIYTFQYIDAERIDQLVKEIFGPVMIKRLYRSAIDRDDNLLIATATAAIHKQIVWLRKEMDVTTKRPGSAVKFYRLKYADAQEVLNTLRAVEQRSGATGDDSFRRGVSPLGRGGVGGSRNIGPGESPIDFVPGANTPNSRPGRESPVPPAVREETRAGAGGELLPPGMALQSRMGTIVPGEARVSVDPNTNAIIVIADRAVQQVYADLIKALDRRRSQVMIEAKVVIIDTSDDFSLGVEISGGKRSGLARVFQFTSYGLSSVNAATGALSLIPGRGFNWTLVNPNVADAVVRALASHRRAQVLSAPRILVNDNATGTLASVTEVPFTSVNASNTVATTSFAGFAEAGTTIEATPRITDDTHLQLTFNIALNSFTGGGGAGIPPPRQTDQLSSEVTIPDGYTVIVGGLTRRNLAQAHNGIPFLEKIPFLRELTSMYNEAQSQTTLFVFLRPVILRDDKFRDLKYLSDRALTESLEPGNFPTAAPLLIR